jgi:branched-chain amino acid transport system permease protein
MLSLPVVAVLLAAAGLVIHFGVVRRLLGAPMLAQVCATFGLAVALRAAAQYLWTPDFRVIADPWIAGRVQLGPIFIGQPQLVAGAVCLVAFIALWLFVTRTETGLALQATAQDRQAAAVMGIPTDRMSAFGWAIGLGCVAVAGTMLSTFFYIFPDVGVNFALLAFVAVALGGFGSIMGSLVAGILIGLVEALGGLLIDPSYKTVIVFALYLVVVIIRPTGLFGRF